MIVKRRDIPLKIHKQLHDYSNLWNYPTPEDTRTENMNYIN
ncbi:hypothetical protein [Paenibacillus sp. FSL R5-0490]|nr:hypothetical protein [Paenibacillus sp. FSL R5-0490]